MRCPKCGSTDWKTKPKTGFRYCNTCHKRRNLDAKRKRLYGITRKQYEEMVMAQCGLCAICGNSDIKPLSVDHCHETGKVRALLCHPCNVGLGLFKDDVSRLENARAYLGGQ